MKVGCGRLERLDDEVQTNKTHQSGFIKPSHRDRSRSKDHQPFGGSGGSIPKVFVTTNLLEK